MNKYNSLEICLKNAKMMLVYYDNNIKAEKERLEKIKPDGIIYDSLLNQVETKSVIKEFQSKIDYYQTQYNKTYEEMKLLIEEIKQMDQQSANEM